jgi:acetyl-CoA carboxylase biotin carboxyl carrier protein
MNFENIKEFIELAKSEGVAELKYEEKDLKIAVSFVTGVQAQSFTPQVTMTASSDATVPTAKDAGQQYHEVKSPFVGTYYGASSPDKPNYVSVGDKVTTGQTLCILEAMKIMNEIESDISGEIVEICVENESLVEYGQTLFKIKA